MAVWVNGAEVVAPAPTTQLVKIVPSAGNNGRVFGLRIVCQEANAAGKIWRLRANVQGQVINYADLDVVNPTFITAMTNSPLAVVKGNGIDFFEVVNVVAGTALTIHQASILYEEVVST